MTLIMIQPAPLTTIQDLGRPHARRWGVPLGGALDRLAHKLANHIVGNAPTAATLEITFGPCVLRCDALVVAALVGAEMTPSLDDQPLRTGQAFLWRPGQHLHLAAATNGARAYLAIQGGLQIPLVLGSRSTLLNGPFPEPLNRPLRAGDRLPLAAQTDFQCAGTTLEISFNEPKMPEIHYWAGPQHSPIPLEDQEWQISPQSNRMGLRLLGAPCLPTPPPIASLGVCPGVIQLPPDGLPIILLADAQTTGGYPVIGTVLSHELNRLAHLKPHDSLRFVPIVSTTIPKIPKSAEINLSRSIEPLDSIKGTPI